MVQSFSTIVGQKSDESISPTEMKSKSISSLYQTPLDSHENLWRNLSMKAIQHEFPYQLSLAVGTTIRRVWLGWRVDL